MVMMVIRVIMLSGNVPGKHTQYDAGGGGDNEGHGHGNDGNQSDNVEW